MKTVPELGRYLHRVMPTPLVPVRLTADDPVVWCKLEFLNPSGSAKDRIARHMLEMARQRGEVKPGSWVVEASSGSTSIALALACAQFGFRFLAVMPEGVSNERLLTVRAYGGEILTIPKEFGMCEAIARAEEEAKKRGGLATRQFSNPDNVEAHRLGTAAEVVADIPEGRVDAVVSGVGTGGTLMGLLEGCRESGSQPRPVLARPTCKLLSDPECCGFSIECCRFSARIPGVIEGASHLYRPELLPDLEILDIDDELAMTMARELIRHGFPVGPSSGLNFAAAVQTAKNMPAEAQVVTVLPDRMERYFSTELFRS